MKALHFAVPSFATLLLAAILSSGAHAAAPKPTVLAGIPVKFDYTYDQGDPVPHEASPTGIRVHYITPWYFGVGVAQYKSALLDKGGYSDLLDGDLETVYRLTELTFNYAIGPVILTYGYGSGRVTYSPESMTISGVTFTRRESDVIARFLGIGILISPTWSINAAWHALSAEVDQQVKVGGFVLDEGKDSLGAIMTTVSVGYSF
jgi:hypothetical protein